ncbi:hypothetical protein M9Y10_022295 [Tritrichomonas musculus]|uniref:UBA domain-containing protein n=1 Tax=Tritrichomonas musculus TaxID=1915356 RepID=A0ABR2KSV2_9EUKA
MFLGDIWIDGAPSLYYFLFIPPVFSLLIWLIELQNIYYLTLRIIHIIFCWFSLFDIFIVELLIWSLRNIERIVGPKQFRVFLFYNFIAYLPLCILSNILSPNTVCIPLGYFYPFSLFIFMLVFIPSSPVFLIITDKLVITLGYILLIAVYIPYSLVPLFGSIIGTIIWNYDIFCLSKCATEPLEISDDDMVVIPRMREHGIHHSRHHTRTINHSNRRNRNRQGININMRMVNPLSDLLQPLNGAANLNIAEEENNEPEVRQSDIRQITEMGFEEPQARNALIRCHNNVQRAVDMLLNGN